MGALGLFFNIAFSRGNSNNIFPKALSCPPKNIPRNTTKNKLMHNAQSSNLGTLISWIRWNLESGTSSGFAPYNSCFTISRWILLVRESTELPLLSGVLSVELPPNCPSSCMSSSIRDANGAREMLFVRLRKFRPLPFAAILNRLPTSKSSTNCSCPSHTPPITRCYAAYLHGHFRLRFQSHRRTHGALPRYTAGIAAAIP